MDNETPAVTSKEFIRRVFDPKTLSDSERVCLTSKTGNNKWINYYGTPKRLQVLMEDEAASYFAVCTIRKNGGRPTRDREHLLSARSLVLDDVGTKALEPPVEPSWKIETSEGNYQWGYLIEPWDVSLAGGRDYYEGCQRAMIEEGCCDPGAKGAYRVMRLPGSRHRTGFLARVTEWHPDRVWALPDLMDAMGVEPVIEPSNSAGGTRQDGVDLEGLEDPALDLMGKLGMLTGNSNDKFVEVVCFNADEHTTGGDTAGYTPIGYTGTQDDGAYSCLHEHCAGLTRNELLDYLEQEGLDRDEHRVAGARAEFDGEAPVAGDEVDDAGVSEVQRVAVGKPNEDNVALVAAEYFKDQYVFLHGSGRWHRWTGTHWEYDADNLLRYELRGMIRRLNIDQKVTPTKRSFMGNVIGYMEDDRVFARRAEAFDLDTWLLNTPSGTVDLRTGETRPHQPQDCITKVTRVSPTRDGGGRFENFLLEVTDVDFELIEFLQVSLGACLSGAIAEHWLLFWTGGGRNGKNTLGDAVQYAMGDYANTVPTEVLMARGNSEHKTEIMTMKGLRLAMSSEVEEGSHWSEVRVNQLTGDATLTARYMRQDYITFPRTHKHLIYGNSRPQLRNVTPALRARIKIVPFNVSFLGREEKGLEERLADEAGYILQWLIDGHVKWMKAGRKLPACTAVEAESSEYFNTQNTLEQWVEEALVQVPVDDRPGGAWPRSSDLYASYQLWARGAGETPRNLKRWGEWMGKRFTKVPVSNVQHYCGLEIRAEEEGENWG